MTKRLDPDLKAIGNAVRALKESSSLRMLRANMDYLWDRFAARPRPDDLQHIRARPAGGSR